MDEDKDFLRQDNNYRTLKAFQKAECIYDVTYYFANTFLKVGDRTIDQMVQAARSGKQNLAEGNIDGSTSRDMELKLTNVNRASLYPRRHRELLRAVVAVRLGISFYKKVNLKALDKAYSIAFPNSTPIDVNKKGKM